MSRIELLQRENKILKDVARLIKIKHKLLLCKDNRIDRVRDMIARRLELYYDNATAQEILLFYSIEQKRKLCSQIKKKSDRNNNV
jgi:hypothetical protein